MLGSKDSTPAMTSFNFATNKFTTPVVLKADVNDTTRRSFLDLGSKEKHRLPTRKPNPYIPSAIIRWFDSTGENFRIPVNFSSFFKKKAGRCNLLFPVEIIRPARHRLVSPTKKSTPVALKGEEEGSKGDREVFQKKNIPLFGLPQVFSQRNPPDFTIYMAQVPIDDLPKELREDLPLPFMISQAAVADIYGSSVWLGSEPTYTSLHRDPNPNYFLQLCGRKYIRLLHPDFGARVYKDVQMSLGSSGNARMRGNEMMTGPEKEALEAAMWGDWFDNGNTPSPSSEVLEIDTLPPPALKQKLTEDVIWEAVVDPGDALFIPLGWWHSVRSSHADARLNGSANWWFRYHEERPMPSIPVIKKSSTEVRYR
ncbi:hypothetical protein MKZ38_001664 [Zalerion maritima]|uniref:JmjC domain-containing protein n=1 Tax=Zalerion maritima TaxID=339359 RepID=A0AAD5RXQ8_9PEZI|nr:hypothetical protein MKZ38_001664 [Zalerion maritima]